MESNLRVAGIVEESIVDGPGFRLAVFTQGCPHHCEGCHNPQTHDPAGGFKISLDEVIQKLRKNPLLDGITLTGGDPFVQAAACAQLARRVKELGMTVVTYTGYTYEQLIQRPDWMALVRQTDLLIDGKFEQAQKSLALKFRGSANQRLIHVKKTLETGAVQEYSEEEF